MNPSEQTKSNWKHREPHHVVLPDGTLLTEAAFASKEDAAGNAVRWIHSFESQGFAAIANHRIPVGELYRRVVISPEEIVPHVLAGRRNCKQLMTETLGHANCSLLRTSDLAGVMFSDGYSGQHSHLVSSYDCLDSVSSVTKTLRLRNLAHGSTVSAFACTAWATVAKAGERCEATRPAATYVERQECVLLAAEAFGQWESRVIPIIRSQNGRFEGFGEPLAQTERRIQVRGRALKLLPDEVPTKAAREEAMAILNGQERRTDHSMENVR